MEPLSPTEEALRRLRDLGEGDVEAMLDRAQEDVLALVPECVGLSLTRLSDGVTLTVAATDLHVRPLDAMQYLDDGPCEAAVAQGEVVHLSDSDALDEERWSFFARACAAPGVQSTLSLPLMVGPDVVGGVNLYASTADAFEGRVDEVAEVLGAWAPGAVRDADLDFSTRVRAAEAPAALDLQRLIAEAVRVIAAMRNLDRDAARRNLKETAARAGITESELARTVVLFHD